MTDDGIEVARKTVESAISDGEAHIRQLDRAAILLANTFPLTASTLHALPESAEQTAQTLNTLHSRWAQMKSVFTTARDFYRAHRARTA